MKLRYSVLVSVIVISTASLVQAVGSGGYSNQVVGSKAFGMGNAFVAVADDASAIFFNPAGILQIDRPTLSAGVSLFEIDTKYKSVSGETSSMENHMPFVPNFYFTTPGFNNRWAFGVGMHSPFGLETHWPEGSSLRYLATDSSLYLLNINPTVAFRLTDKILVGAGVVYGQVNAKLESKLNQTALNTVLNGGTLSPTNDGDKVLEGDGNAWGYDFGILLKPADKHSLGFTYRSKISANLDGTLELKDINGTAATGPYFGSTHYKTNIKTEVVFPSSLLMGYAYKPGDWTFAIDGELVNYSSVNETHINYTSESDPTRLSILNTGNPINRDWHNSWNLALGTNYKFNDTWQARGGYFYFNKSIPTYTWDPSNPENSRNGFTVGGSYSNAPFVIDLAYNLLLFNERNIRNSVGTNSNSTADGKYNTSAHVYSINITFQF